MKSTSRDIWAIPPGGFQTKPARNWIRPTVAAGLVLLLGIGGGALYSSMKKSTAVTTQDAIAQFRADSGAGKDSEPDRKPNRKERAEGKNAPKRLDAGKQIAAASGSTEASDTTTSEQASTGASKQDTAATRGSDKTRSSNASPSGHPEEGVYTWNIEGVERGPGIERRLPRRSHRIITLKGNDRWVEHHIFSEQKEQWFDLGNYGDGVAVSAVRNRVEMGPVEVDKTVTYDPVAYVSRFPMEVGQRWRGTWDGPTRGSYEGRTIEHGTLTIGGEKVEVYATEVRMEMRGEVEGTVITRSWVAPAYNMVVKQYQETDVKSGPGNYYCEWQGQVASLRPER